MAETAGLEAELADLHERVQELEAQLERANQLSDQARESNRDSYDRLVAEKNDLIAQVAQWADFADSLGYEFQGAEYGWQHAPRRSCGSHVSGQLTESNVDVRAGPILFAGALSHAQEPAEQFEPVDGDLYMGRKILAVVDAGVRVLVVVPEEESGHLSLGWTMREPIRSYAHSLRPGEPAPMWVGERGIVFEACADFQTQFDGGVRVAGAHCASLDVYTLADPHPLRVTIPFGIGSC